MYLSRHLILGFALLVTVASGWMLHARTSEKENAHQPTVSTLGEGEDRASGEPEEPGQGMDGTGGGPHTAAAHSGGSPVAAQGTGRPARGQAGSNRASGRAISWLPDGRAFRSAGSAPVGSAGSPPVASIDGTAAAPGAPRAATDPTNGGRIPTSSGSSTLGQAPTGSGSPAAASAPSIIANGDHIVIAMDGSIVSVGDNTVVHGNTGDASMGASIGIDLDGSSVATGDSTASYGPTSTGASGLGVARQASSAGSPGGAATSTSTASGSATAVAGWEDRSLEVAGSDNVLTYQDSNAFIDRAGVLNGNTGDTSTAGVNVVDSSRSQVRTGSSTIVSSLAPGEGASSALPLVPLGSNGPGGAATVADARGIAAATGDRALVIGGDGIEDRAVSLRGDRNVVTYDDGNVAVGGTGDVNAQNGESETSGAVVMAVRDSDISSGSSRLALRGSGPTSGETDPGVSP